MTSDRPNRTLYLHIGAHKTGTTSIQAACWKNRAELNAHGWDFAALPKKAKNWGYAFKFDRTYGAPCFTLHDNMIEKIKTCLDSPYNNVILSAEDLFFFEEAAINDFIKHIEPLFNEIKVIAYLRRQDSMGVSQKAQAARTVQSAVFFGVEDFPLPHQTANTRAYLDYNARLDLWKRSSPRVSIIARHFSKSSLHNSDIVADFFQALELDITSENYHLNSALSGNSIRLLLKLRSEADYWQADIKHIISSGWLEQDKSRFLPTRQEARQFFDSFAAENKALYDTYGITFDQDFNSYPKTVTNKKYNAYEARMIKRLVEKLSLEASPNDLDKLSKITERSSEKAQSSWRFWQK